MCHTRKVTWYGHIEDEGWKTWIFPVEMGAERQGMESMDISSGDGCRDKGWKTWIFPVEIGTAKYEDLSRQCRDEGWKTWIFPVEMGAETRDGKHGYFQWRWVPDDLLQSPFGDSTALVAKGNGRKSVVNRLDMQPKER